MKLTLSEKIEINKYITSNQEIISSNAIKMDLQKTKEAVVYLVNELQKKLEASIKEYKVAKDTILNRNISCIMTFLQPIIENNLKSEIPKETIQKIENIKELFTEYKLILEGMQDFDKLNFSQFFEFFEKNFEINEMKENKSKDVEKEENTSLEQQIKKLEEFIKEKEKEVEKLEKETSRKDKTIEKNKKDLIDLREAIEKLKRENETLKQKMFEFEKSINNKKESEEKTKKEFDELNSRIEKLNAEINRLKSIIEDKNAKIKEIRVISEEKTAEESAREINIKKILDLFFSTKEYYTLDEIYEKLARSISKDEIHKLLIGINNSLKVIPERNITFPIKYGLYSCCLLRNSHFYFNPNLNAIDIIFKGDMHIEKFNSNNKLLMDSLANYVATNNIKLVVDLGDFLNCCILPNNAYDYYHIVDNIRSISENIPNMGIPQGFIIGNHERKYTNIGINATSILTSEREDLINLGDEHGFITLDGCQTIGIHHGKHTEAFCQQEDVKNKNIFRTDLFKECVTKYYSEYYQGANVLKENIFADISAHIHCGLINLQEGIFVVPKFNTPDLTSGLYHIRFYPKSNYCIIRPLVLNVNSKNFVFSTEIEYSKVRKLVK